MSNVIYRVCSKDGHPYPIEFFAIKQIKGQCIDPKNKDRRDTICKGCRQSAKDEYKKAHRFMHKVSDTRRRHAYKFKMTVKELEDLGWKLDRMEHEAKHFYANGCQRCGRPYSEMEHGLGDLTLDIIAPDAPKVYGTNTRWICLTCNRNKSKTDVSEQASIDVGWMLWEKYQEETKRNAMYGLPLFSSFESQPKLDWTGHYLNA